MANTQEPVVPFGRQFKAKYFPFKATNNHTNHGSFGSVPIPVLETYKEFMLQDLSHPDEFIFAYQQKYMEDSLKTTSKLLNADYKNLAYVNSASFGVNVILRSYPFQSGDKILITSTIYGSCYNTIDYVAKRYNLEIITIELNFPLSDDAIISKFETALQKDQIKLALYDTVISMPGLKLPFREITHLCRKYGALSCIDGAHSIGLIPIDLTDINPDFYTSNLHKWLFVPRGCAILYVKPEHQKLIQSFPIGHSYGDDVAFYKRFLFPGSSNFSSFYCVDSAVNFRNEVCGGEQKIKDYCFRLARQVIDKFGKDRIIENEQGTLTTAMVNIKVELTDDQFKFYDAQSDNREFWGEFRSFVQRKMLDNDNTYAQFLWHNKILYIRFSCQVFNELDDYVEAYAAFERGLKDFYQSELYFKYALKI